MENEYVIVGGVLIAALILIVGGFLFLLRTLYTDLSPDRGAGNGED